MKTAVVTAEYNPFHNGHKKQLEYIRKELSADAIAVLLSGNFVQRGGPAIADKYERAVCAIENGADLVLQLPFVYCAQTAEMFARGAVGIASGINADMMVFGCDKAHWEELQAIAELLNNETPEFKLALRKNLLSMRSYPAARLAAINAVTGIDCVFLQKANNILALEYIRAPHRNMSKMKFVPCEIFEGENIRTASYIRELILRGDIGEAKKYMPEKSCISSEPRSIEEYNIAIKTILLANSAVMLSQTADADEALVNRLKAFSDLLNSGTENYISKVCTKNFTKSKIRRTLINMLVGYTAGEMAYFKNNLPSVLRVLAANSTGREMINLSNSSGETLITGNMNKAFEEMDETDKLALLYSNKAENFYSMFTEGFDRDIKRGPVII